MCWNVRAQTVGEESGLMQDFFFSPLPFLDLFRPTWPHLAREQLGPLEEDGQTWRLLRGVKPEAPLLHPGYLLLLQKENTSRDLLDRLKAPFFYVLVDLGSLKY